MSGKSSVCREIEPSLLAAAMGEADGAEMARLAPHVNTCGSCRVALEHYRAVDTLVNTARTDTLPTTRLAAAREGLRQRLVALRQCLLRYGVFPSPLGPIVIACSETGVAWVEYLGRRNVNGSRLSRLTGLEAVERQQEIEPLYRQLLDYLTRRRANLDWSLDLRLARSAFQRKVLQATAGLPYGAVASYTALARNVGKPRGVRAVAQALRWNPLPIAVPCHRVIGTAGFLTGYVGGKVMRKRRLLAVEGIQLVQARGDFRIDPKIMYANAPGDHTYCVPTCRSLRRMRPGLAMLFASRQSAEAAGLSPCTTCRPDLYPISREVAS